MTKLRIISITSLILTLLFGSVAIVKAAPPGLPSSFYGEIHFMPEDGGPSAGDTIDAYVPDVTSSVASAVIFTYETDLVYYIDVPADDPATTSVKEGGQEDELVTFKIGGRIVATGTWHSGSNVALNIHPPKANPGDPYVAVVNEETTLSGSATDWSTTDTFTYAWDLDNDSTYDDSTLQTPAHTFTTTGTKTINLKVTDSQNGEGFTSTDVVVIDISGLTGQVYDGTGKSVTVTGVETPYTYEVTYDDLATLPIDADSYTVDIDISDGGTAIDTVTKTMVIIPKSASVTPNPASKTYGESDPAFSGSLSGFITADNVTATYSRTLGETVAGSPYTISATLIPINVLSNYDITYNTANFTIDPKTASVTPDPKSKTYGEADPLLTGSLSGFLAGDGVSATYSRTEGETVAGSPYTISASLSPTNVLGNYDITYNSANFTINERPITVTADNKSKVFGEADPDLTYQITDGSLVSPDTFSGSLAREAGEDPGTYEIGQGNLSLSNDYDLTFISGTFTITPLFHSIDLLSGWNLVSFNLQPSDTAIEQVLANIDGNYDLVYAWDATGAHSTSGNWMIYDPSAGFGNTLNILDNKMGFWIHMTQADTLDVHGSYQTSTDINLLTTAAGWNLVGFPSSSDAAPSDTFIDVLTNISLVYEYDASATTNLWKIYDPAAPDYANDLDLIRPGFGYWVLVEGDDDWIVDY